MDIDYDEMRDFVNLVQSSTRDRMIPPSAVLHSLRLLTVASTPTHLCVDYQPNDEGMRWEAVALTEAKQLARVIATSSRKHWDWKSDMNLGVPDHVELDAWLRPVGSIRELRLTSLVSYGDGSHRAPAMDHAIGQWMVRFEDGVEVGLSRHNAPSDSNGDLLARHLMTLL